MPSNTAETGTINQSGNPQASVLLGWSFPHGDDPNKRKTMLMLILRVFSFWPRSAIVALVVSIVAAHVVVVAARRSFAFR